MNNLEKLLVNSATNIGIDIDISMVNQFMQYKDLLLYWNNNINLTSIIEEKEIILKHFIDSISPLKYLDTKGDLSIIDVGTGAGFPGVPIKIVKPNYNVTLLDSLNKRIKFLDIVIKDLKLKNIYSIHGRAEDYGKKEDLREKFDIAVSRAVSNLATLCEYNLPFVKLGGTFISFKGPEINSEIKDAYKAIKALGGIVDDIKYVNIPETDIKHSLIFITKVSQTSFKYPRSLSKIKRNPII